MRELNDTISFEWFTRRALACLVQHGGDHCQIGIGRVPREQKICTERDMCF